ncbi:MAG: glycosyltransferase 87 family protein [Pseudonocardia sp.]
MTDVAARPESRIAGAGLLRIARNPRLALPIGAAMLAVAIAVLVVKFGGRHIDLEVYRFGVWALLDGGDPYVTLPPTAVGAVLPFIYPPFAAFVLMPFAFVPWEVAWPALMAASTVALALALYVTARALWPSGGRRGALGAAALALPLSFALEPVHSTIDFGQVNLLLMALVAADCLVARPRWPRGVLVGIAAAVKLTPAAFVLFFLLRGDRKAAVTAAVSGGIATLVAFALAPTASLRFWLDNPAGGVSAAPFYTNQTFQAVLVRAGVDGVARTAGWLVLSLAVLLLAAPAIRRAPAPLAMVATAAVALLVSPTSWSHHWVWVAPAMMVLAVTAWRAWSWRWALVTLLSAAVFVGAPHVWGLPRADGRELAWTPLQQVWGSTFTWFTVLLLVALYVAWRRRPAHEAVPAAPVRPDGPAEGVVG